MKAVGIVAEYNPFHNGHRYHAEQARQLTGSDAVIAVMSGNFLQRGEPALVDKWTRTAMALENGIDLVIELPYETATANASGFADGAIRLLDAACCSSYCFGSEQGAIGPFAETLRRIKSNRPYYEEQVRNAVKSGISYPKALNDAYELTIRQSQEDPVCADLSKPNNILGFHYMEAADEIGSRMGAVTIPRLGAGYYDDISADTHIASATGIRKELFSEGGRLEGIRAYVPAATYELLSDWLAQRSRFGSWDSFYPLLRFQILRDGPERLGGIADITEGIEHLLYKAAKQSEDFASFMAQVKSKRYTWTRLQRMLVHILTGFTYEQRIAAGNPDHLRVLGMTAAGRRYLKEQKGRLALPAVSRLAAHDSVSADISAHVSDCYAFGIDPVHPLTGLDFRTPPLLSD
ncbi:nucleotidyltransferase [Sporosarcina koreensis]|uniref:nucleotidyltransferase n=1 Tax=Sporosarcina koreensis TaxID=334735 RepID=UPI00058D2C2E|nr:nucleotidyltransferase [Sporosarcina koreensis]